MSSQPADTPPPESPPPLLDAAALGAALASAAADSWGFVLATTGPAPDAALSRFLAEERADFDTNRVTCLTLAPVQDWAGLAPGDTVPVLLVKLDERMLGRASAESVVAALAAIAPDLPARRAMVLHGFAGHRAADLLALTTELRPQSRWVWLHDHTALCTGGRLLRNDLVPCGAPPAGSQSCLVCRHGNVRAAHLAAVGQLIAGLQAQIVAPSADALALWRRAGPLPAAPARVQPPLRIVTRPGDPAVHPERGLPEDPVRVALIGALDATATAAFADILRWCQRLPTYRFFGVGAEALSPANNFADAIAAQRIDIALCLGAGPDGFAIEVVEALGGGAMVVALAGSGAAALAASIGPAAVLADQPALTRFFTSGTAIAEARRLADRGRPVAVRRLWGTTASLDAGGTAPVAEAARWTDDPGLVVLAADGARAATRDGQALHVGLPPDAGPVRLLSRRQRDGRGLEVARVLLDSTEVPPGDPRLLAGWQMIDGRLVTDGDARLEPGPARLLVLEMPAGILYPRLPFLGPT